MVILCIEGGGGRNPHGRSIVISDRGRKKQHVGVSNDEKPPTLAGASLVLPLEGVYVGDGVPPVPQKLAEHIQRGGYMEMRELLLEFWSSPRDRHFQVHTWR